MPVYIPHSDPRLARRGSISIDYSDKRYFYFLVFLLISFKVDGRARCNALQRYIARKGKERLKDTVGESSLDRSPVASFSQYYEFLFLMTYKAIGQYPLITGRKSLHKLLACAFGFIFDSLLLFFLVQSINSRPPLHKLTVCATSFWIHSRVGYEFSVSRLVGKAYDQLEVARYRVLFPPRAARPMFEDHVLWRRVDGCCQSQCLKHQS